MVRLVPSRFARGGPATVAVFVLALAGAALGAPAKVPPPPAPGGPQFFLSWHRPWGEPGAERLGRPACADTASADTLFLCLRPGVDMPSFVAFTGELSFHAEKPETLGTYWHFGRDAENQGGLSVRLQPEDEDTGWVQPWRSKGTGGVGYLWTPRTGTLRMIYAVEPAKAVPLQGNRTYTLARIVIRARVPGLAGCGQGIAVELSRATLATDGMHEYAITSGGSRYAGSGRRAITALARLWHVDEQAARWRLNRVEPGGAWPPAK
jgi:hypothetical protein